MTRSKSIIGALVLCALAICAFGAANASAVGMTAVECQEVSPGTGHYNTSHCVTPEVPGNFETVALPLNTSKELQGTSTNATGGPEPSKLTAVLGGLNVIVTCAVAHSTGSVTNVEVGTEHKAHGTNTVITYTECHTVLASNPAKTCNVSGTTGGVGAGKIQTRPLTSTTGAEHKIKFEPETLEEAKAIFTKFSILTTGTECFFKTAVAVTVEGSVEGEASTTTHSHVTLTEANNGLLLKANGATAHYVGTNGAWTPATEKEVEEGKQKTVGLQTF